MQFHRALSLLAWGKISVFDPRESAKIRGEKPLISVLQLGTIDYATGLRVQKQLVDLRKAEKIGDVLLLLEHKPVITLGRNANAANVIALPELLAERGVELFECDRGGDVTFHGPGQLVGYPIFDLRGYASGAADALVRRDESKTRPDLSLRKTLGAVDFVRLLEEVLIRTCADFTIETKRIPGLTGVWTNPHPLPSSNPMSSRAEQNDSKNRPAQSRDLLSAAPTATHVATAASAVRPSEARTNVPEPNLPAPEAKIAAIGIHISRSVTSHGFALNVNPDLTYFNLIIPCGITAKPVASMQKELGKPLDMTAVAESISRNFSKVFTTQILWVETIDALLGHTVGVPMKPPAELRQLHKEDTFWS